MNDNLSWGKPRIFIKRTDASASASEKNWNEIATPVEDSTELQPTKGEKVEAKIEGGENEGVRNKRNTYALVANIRVKNSNKLPFAIVDGVVEGEWSLMLQPEDPTAYGISIAKGTISIEDSYKAADGGVWGFTFDALKKDKSTPQVQWGTVSVEESGGSISAISLLPISSNDSLIPLFGSSYKRSGVVTELKKIDSSIDDESSDVEILAAVTKLETSQLTSFKNAIQTYKVTGV